MIVKTMRGNEDHHHPFCVKKYKERFQDGWKCQCELYDEYDKWNKYDMDKTYVKLKDIKEIK